MDALTRLYRERGGLDDLILVGLPTVTPGMVRVARIGDNWQAHPELVWQVWPDDLELVATDLDSEPQP